MYLAPASAEWWRYLSKATSAAIGTLFTTKTAVSFLVFTLLYTPCIAAVATIRRELNSVVKTAGVILMQCSVAWVVSLIAYTLARLL